MFSRYLNDTPTGLGGFTSGFAVSNIRQALRSGDLAYKTEITVEGDRLDIIAQREYGDGRLWWVIAAASHIGWWLQVPPGIAIRIPTDLAEIRDLV